MRPQQDSDYPGPVTKDTTSRDPSPSAAWLGRAVLAQASCFHLLPYLGSPPESQPLLNPSSLGRGMTMNKAGGESAEGVGEGDGL